jgi:hypothetical protein
MPDTFGNAGLKLPGQTVTKALQTPGQIWSNYDEGALIKGATLKGGQGILPAGTVIAHETATKKYVVYNNAGSGGAQVAKGILLERTDTGLSAAGTSADCAANIVLGGSMKLSALSGLDAAAITVLNGRSDAERDAFIF